MGDGGPLTASGPTAFNIRRRSPPELKQLFREWLELHYPDDASHTITLIQQMNG